MTKMMNVHRVPGKPALAGPSQPLVSATLSFANMHQHGDLMARIFRERKESFIVTKKWDLPEALGMEYDQYDTPASRWIAIHQDGEVMGGMRLTPTNARCGVYSYMIRDAQRGLIDTIPADLLYEEAPVSNLIWESTRVFVSQSAPMAIRRKVHLMMVNEMIEATRREGGDQIIALTAGNWPRWYGRRGLVARAIGPMMNIDGGEFQCVMIDAGQPAELVEPNDPAAA